MSQRMDSTVRKAVDDLADSLRTVWGLAQDLMDAPTARERGDEGKVHFMDDLREPLNVSLWSACYRVAVALGRSRSNSALRMQAALELLHICPILRGMKNRLEALGDLEEKKKSDEEEVGDFERDLMETLNRIRIVIQFAGKRVRLKRLTQS
jgi:hypothetical protein